MAARKSPVKHDDQIILLLAQIRELQMAQLISFCYSPDDTEETNFGRVAQYIAMARQAYAAADASDA